jgi:hypothetical protein
MKAKYIDKTFPITLQDLIDLAKSENLDPKDLKLIMNSNQADLSAYVQCALLNQDCDKISIELYTEASDGLHEDLSLKTKPKSPLKQNKEVLKYEYLKEIKALVENMESDGISSTTIISILKQGSKGYI